MGIQDLDLFDLLGQNGAKIGQPFGEKRLIGKEDVIRRQGRSVRELCLGAQVEDDPGPILGVLQCFAEQTIGRADFIRRAGQN